MTMILDLYTLLNGQTARDGCIREAANKGPCLLRTTERPARECGEQMFSASLQGSDRKPRI